MVEGVASIALLPCGSISGHFIQLPHSICYGLHGTGITICVCPCLFSLFMIIMLSLVSFVGLELSQLVLQMFLVEVVTGSTLVSQKKKGCTLGDAFIVIYFTSVGQAYY